MYRSPRFLVDVASVGVDWTYIIMAIYENGGLDLTVDTSGGLGGMRILRFVRLARLARLLKLKKIFEVRAGELGENEMEN